MSAPAVTAAAMAGALPIVALPLLPANGALEIHMIDVGQGDAIALRSPRGRWLLVDAGPVSRRFDAGRSIVVPFLLRRQAGTLAAVLLSHPHLDHFGGLPAIARQIPVAAVLDPALPVPGADYDSLLALARRDRLKWLHARTGTRMTIDGVHIEFLAPDAVVLDASADANDFSAVFRVSYGDFSALFTGDLPAGAELRLIEQFGDRLDVDLLKVGHHGSGGSSTSELLLATSPRVALVSAGRRNRYGHPHPAALERLELAGARVFRTDRDGTVSVSVRRNGAITVATQQ
jgi:competence protein ComEC